MQVEDFTQAVLASRSDPSEWQGTSDHRIHGQVVYLKRGSTWIDFKLITFNLLDSRWLKYQNGIWPEGKVPSWYSLEGQQGLENAPLAQVESQANRERANLEIIKDIFNDKANKGGSSVKIPIVVCLQECGGQLRRQIIEFAETFGIGYNCVMDPQSSSDEDDKMVLFQGCELSLRRQASTHSIYALTFENVLGFLNLVNVHLDFNTEKNTAVLEDIAKYCDCGLVAGDWNIQVKAISENTLKEGSSKTLIEYFGAGSFWKRCLFALHPDGWTNFNCRKNCQDPQNNADHMDNIMFFSQEDKTGVGFKPMTINEKFGWYCRIW
jgi:hypothetical protein